MRVVKCLCMASLVQGPQVRLLTTSHCHPFWCIELTAKPLGAWEPHCCHLPPPCTTQGKPHEPQRYQRWHQSSWHREWHLPAGGNVQSSPLGPCVCSKEKRGARVNSGPAQVLACPLLLNADLKEEDTARFYPEKVCVRGRSYFCSANAALKYNYGFACQSSAGRLEAPHAQGRSSACSLHLTREHSKKAPAGINWADGATSSQVHCNFDPKEREKDIYFLNSEGCSVSLLSGVVMV